MKNLDILFFTPPIFTDGLLDRNRLVDDNGHGKDIPKGLHCIASYLKGKGKGVSLVITDSFFSKAITSENLLVSAVNSLVSRKVGQYDPAYIGFNMMYGLTESKVVSMTRFAKKAFPDKIVVVGGNHATFIVDRLLSDEYETGIDVVVRGEGERTVEELVSGMSWDNISGISFRANNGSIHHNSPRPLSSILNLPSCDYGVLDIGEGVELCDFNNFLQYMRGCSFRCRFCTNEKMWNAHSRPISEEAFCGDLYALQNLSEQLSEPPVTILLDDDILAIPKYRSNLLGILEEAKKVHPSARFVVQTRVSVVYRDDENTNQFLAWCARAGVACIFLGVETGSQEIMNSMDKRCCVQWIAPACKNIQRHGIAVGAFWMLGHPGANLDEEKKSLDVLDSLLSRKLIDLTELHVTVPFPGSRIREDSRVRLFLSQEEEVRRYTLVDDRPIHYLVDPDNGKTVLSPEQITELYWQGMKIKERHLGNANIMPVAGRDLPI